MKFFRHPFIPPPPPPSAVNHKKLLSEVEELDFFRYAKLEALERERERILQSGWSGLFGDNGRLFSCDAEELAEGGVSEFIAELASFLEAQGVEIPSVEDDFGIGEEYALTLGPVRFPIWTQAEYERDLVEPGLLWGLSSTRTVKLINAWLNRTRSDERAYGVNAGNEFEVFFLTPRLYERIVRDPEALPYYGPYMPNEQYPSFGQPSRIL